MKVGSLRPNFLKLGGGGGVYAPWAEEWGPMDPGHLCSAAPEKQRVAVKWNLGGGIMACDKVYTPE